MALSPRVQAQLEADLRGRPIPYRRKPGGPSNVWVNPYTGQEVSEYYVVRVYRPYLYQNEQAAAYAVQQLSRGQLRRAQEMKLSLAETYVLVQAANGQPVTNVNEVLKQEEFNRIVELLEAERFRLRFLEPVERDAQTGPSSELAELLVLVGRRLGDEDFDVGDSPDDYVRNVVIPTLQARVNKSSDRLDQEAMATTLGAEDVSSMSDRQLRIYIERNV